MSKNWVNETLDAAAQVVRDWPEWMRRPEVRVTGIYSPERKQKVRDR